MTRWKRPDARRLRAHAPALGLWLALCGPAALVVASLDGAQRWATAAAFPLLGVCVLVRRRSPLTALALPVAPSLVISLDLFTTGYCAALAAFGYLAGVRLSRARPALWFFSAVAAGGLPLAAVVGRTVWPWFSLLLTLLLNVVLPWLLGRYRRQYAELARTGWQLAERMEREQQAVADRTRLRERARIAGDMHDSLGHDLALIALRAGALEVDPRLDADRQAAAGELRAAAGTATERLREIIGVLRTDDESAPRVPADESVAGLVGRARASGMTVTLEQADGTGTGTLPAMTGHALHRVVQESLTNAAKHAPGAAVRVRIGRAAGQVQVTVANTAGTARPGAGPVSGGSGLVGLDERVRLAGGALRAGPDPEGGFTVSARLPTAGGALPESLARPEPTASQRELAYAQRQVRRRLRQMVAAPVALLAALVLLSSVYHLVSPSWTVLERERYTALRLGADRSRVESQLPFFALDAPPDGTPPPPHDWTCLYYSVHPRSDSAYQLCFTDDERLAKKSVVHRRDR
ncbi:two-component sensor histidine kinase [Streptomyces glebosus]|uniref:histidine kinase n=1 Tax=Streptomyces glebosus TaxID=249580 RepID=A0A640SW02_9ACTN|nr:histidine kinase [Streptomyces glebosus]GFE14266.1 two-component sensor histidine kinase [Streptomyces glebosus]GHG54562.1 two-component sensor histidine kinase [Streptomyces glebosus]